MSATLHDLQASLANLGQTTIELDDQLDEQVDDLSIEITEVNTTGAAGKVFQERDYQRKIVNKTIESIGEGIPSVLIESPCGSGKTCMGLLTAQWISENAQQLFSVQPSEVGFMWVAMRRTLLAQATRDNEAMVGVPNLEPVSMFEKTAVERMNAKYKVVIPILDEAHHASVNTAVTLLNGIKPRFYLGLSATPLRTDHTELCFSRTIRDAGYHRLIQEGWLSKFHHYSMEDAFSPENTARVFLQYRERWGKSVIFFLTEEDCKTCAGILTEGGVRCEIVTGSTNKGAQIAKFEAGEVDVLLNMVVLTEGFDCPQLQTVFVRDTHNRLPAIQMSGRVLRLHDDLPVKNIVQSEKTGYPFTRVAKAKLRFLERENEWLAIDESDAVQKELRRTMVPTKVVRVPDFIRFGGDVVKARKFRIQEAQKLANPPADDENSFIF